MSEACLFSGIAILVLALVLIGFAVWVFFLRREVRRLSIDWETGALRKGLFMEKVQALLYRAHNQNVFLYCLMYFDIDGLKRVNDRFGHWMGDELIKLVANAIRRHIRPNDIFGRMGGDEFSALLINLNEKREPISHERMEEIKKEIREEIDADPRFKGLGVGVSVGYFIGDSRKVPFEGALTIADGEMLRDKEDRGIHRGFEDKKEEKKD